MEDGTAQTTYRWAVYKATDTVEQMRIDFVEFDIAEPEMGMCSNESMTIMGADAVTNKILPSSLCGVLTGQHLRLRRDQDREAGGEVHQRCLGQGREDRWRAPHGLPRALGRRHGQAAGACLGAARRLRQQLPRAI